MRVQLLLILVACTESADTDSSSSESESAPCEGVWFTGEDGEALEVGADFADGGEVSWLNDGTLHFCAGDWPVQLVFTATSLTLEGDGAERTVLDGQLAGPVLTVASEAEVTVQDLTLTGGTAGIVSERTVTLAVVDAVVAENADASGLATGIRMTGTLTLDGAVVRDNVAGVASDDSVSCEGAGIWVDGSILANDSAITGNRSTCTVDGSLASVGEAEGAALVSSGNISLERCTITDNALTLAVDGGFATVRGGAVRALGVVHGTDTVVADNQLQVALGCDDGRLCTLVAEGGAVLASRIELYGSEVRDNAVTVMHSEEDDSEYSESTVRGAGLCASIIAVQDTWVTGNVLAGEADVGGEVAWQGGGAWAGNSLVCNDGGFIENRAPDGGGVYWQADGVTLTSADCDWGTEGVDDNDTGDVRGAVSVDVDGVASFSCDPEGCQ